MLRNRLLLWKYTLELMVQVADFFLEQYRSNKDLAWDKDILLSATNCFLNTYYS